MAATVRMTPQVNFLFWVTERVLLSNNEHHWTEFCLKRQESLSYPGAFRLCMANENFFFSPRRPVNVLRHKAIQPVVARQIFYTIQWCYVRGNIPNVCQKRLLFLSLASQDTTSKIFWKLMYFICGDIAYTFALMSQQPPEGQGFIIEASRSHSGTPRSVV